MMEGDEALHGTLEMSLASEGYRDLRAMPGYDRIRVDPLHLAIAVEPACPSVRRQI